MKPLRTLLTLTTVLVAFTAYPQYEFSELDSCPQSVEDVVKLCKERKFTEVSEKYIKAHFIQIRNEVSSLAPKYCFVYGKFKVRDCEFLLFEYSSPLSQYYYVAVLNNDGRYPPLLQIGNADGGALGSNFVLLNQDSIIITTIKNDAEYPYFCQETYRLDCNFTRISEPFSDENGDDYWGYDQMEEFAAHPHVEW